MHQFRNRRREFFVVPSPEGRPPGKQTRLREQVIALRKQNLSVHDISRSLAAEGESLSPSLEEYVLREFFRPRRLRLGGRRRTNG